MFLIIFHSVGQDQLRDLFIVRIADLADPACLNGILDRAVRLLQMAAVLEAAFSLDRRKIRDARGKTVQLHIMKIQR